MTTQLPSNTEILEGINLAIAKLGERQLQSTCPTGTINYMKVACDTSASFTFSSGDTTSSGYYMAQTVAIDDIKGLAAFAVPEVPTPAYNNGVYVFNSGVTCPYYAQPSIDGNSQMSYYAYAPQQSISLCGACYGGDDWLGATECNCTSEIMPSTFNQSSVAAADEAVVMTLEDTQLVTQLTYSISATEPTGYTFPIIVYVEEQLASPVYLYGVSFENLLLQCDDAVVTYPSYNTSEAITISPGTIEGILTNYSNTLMERLNDGFNGMGVIFSTANDQWAPGSEQWAPGGGSENW